jgi:hypothetical protein
LLNHPHIGQLHDIGAGHLVLERSEKPRTTVGKELIAIGPKRV